MTGVAEMRDVTLEDGSRVVLDAGSAFAIDYTPERRTVRLLAGQAFFRVAHSSERPFVVKASDVAVTVTGTSFNVGTSNAGVAVAVETGSVSVSRDGRELASLTLGDRLQVQPNGGVVRGSIAPIDVAAWRMRRLVVHEAPVREVVEEIGRHVHGVIFFRDEQVADRRVTGVIDLSQPEEALQAVVGLQGGKTLKVAPYLTVILSR
jgi:transmembrane sensor